MRLQAEGNVRNSSLHCVFLLLLGIVNLVQPQPVPAQPKPAGASPLCTRDNALETIKQQLELAKSLNPTQHIATLIRAGDLLWPYQQDKARAAFTEAFELAVETEKEGANTKQQQSVILRMQVSDQRFVVIAAVAKRDSAWAKELTEQLTKLETETAQIPPGRDSFSNSLTGNRLMLAASRMLETDTNAGVDLARLSLNYPASFLLTYFLYRLAAINQQTADQFYVQALVAYGNKPLREFLYLQAYPFAWRETLNTPSFSFHDNVPANFVPNPDLQSRFLQLFLHRSQQILESPLDLKDTYQAPNGAWVPSTVHILEGLIRLEPQVRESLPNLLPALTDMREKILVSLSVEDQKLFLQPGREASLAPKQTFAERIELAQKSPDVYERDGLIASAVLGTGSESLASVIQAIDTISDATLRALLSEWLYFQRAAAAIKNKQFAEAERFTARVDGIEQRAFLHTEIAKGLLKSNDSAAHAREVLDEAITEAKKAGATIFAARALLTAASLYARIELSRSIEVLADAINCVNRLEAPDFVSDDQALSKKPRRTGRGGRYNGEYHLQFYMPGLDPESAFREWARTDFDTSLAQSSALKDKFQRGISALSIAEVCLQRPAQPKPDPKRKGRQRPALSDFTLVPQH